MTSLLKNFYPHNRLITSNNQRLIIQLGRSFTLGVEFDMKDPSRSSESREIRQRNRVLQPHRKHDSYQTRGHPLSQKHHDTTPNREYSPSRAMSKKADRADKEDEYLTSQTPWTSLLPSNKIYDIAEQRLHHEIIAYMTYMEQTPREKQVRQSVIERLRRAIRGRFRSADTAVFGSSATGLCLPTSDIDMAVSIPSRTPIDTKKTLYQLAAYLRSSDFVASATVRQHSRVPIISLTTREKYGSLGADISISNHTGEQAVGILKEHIVHLPALKPLVLIIKGFLRQRKLNDASQGGLSSYAITCMCIHLLQLNPSNRVQEYLDKPLETESLGFLLVDFMFYYGLTFDNKSSYISLSTSPGIVLPKSEPSNRLSIRCLVCPDNEIAKSLSRPDILLGLFKEAYASILQFNATDDNLLGKLVRVSCKFIDQRACLASGMLLNEDDAHRRSTNPCRVAYHPLPPRPITFPTNIIPMFEIPRSR